MKKIIIWLLMTCLCAIANAQVKGNKLNEWLAAEERLERGQKDSVDYTLSASGLYYITGVLESFSNMGLLCVPDGVTLGQLRAVVQKYMKDNPEKWNQDANALVFVAISKAFPCKKK